MSEPPGAAANGVAPVEGPVTVVVTRRVRRGREDAYEAALAALQRDSTAFGGYLGATTQRPAAGAPPEYTSVFRFARVADLRAFEASPRRAAFLAEVALLTWWLMPRLTRWLAPWIYPRRTIAT